MSLRQTIVQKSWHDGALHIMKTCCAWDSPEHPGDKGHGMHVGGYNPFWISLDDGEWQNLQGIHEHKTRRWPLLAECANSRAEFLDAIGPLSKKETTGGQ